MGRPRLAVLLLLLLLGCVAEARRHRYGGTTTRERRSQQQKRALDDDITEVGEDDDFIKGEMWQDEVYALSRRHARESDWPPRWSGPVVGLATLWYLSFFF